MRYRKLDADGDSTFGHGAADFHRDTPDAVAQLVMTRLLLLRGEWFLDLSEGMPWATEVLAENTQNTYNLAIRDRILGTEGVTGITAYSSSQDRDKRSLTVSATIDTVYGQTTIAQVL